VVGIGRVEGKEYAYYGESHSNEVDISTMLMDAELSFAHRFREFGSPWQACVGNIILNFTIPIIAPAIIILNTASG